MCRAILKGAATVRRFFRIDLHMKKLLLLAVLTLALSSAAAAAELEETIDRTFDVRAGASVSLDNTNGNVVIASWDQPRVRIVAHKVVKTGKSQLQKAMRELRVVMQPQAGGVSVETHYPRENDGWDSLLGWIAGDRVRASVQYEVTVPRSMNLDISTVNGRIRVANVTGRHELETTNGGIDVERCAGSVDASTTNGTIEAELVNVAKGQPMRFSTTNGRIEVALPHDLAFDVDASTTNGSIASDLPVSATRGSRNSLRGSVNGGGTPLKLRTTNGGISIRTRK
jgi:opacity protein-like surface antigen